MLAPAYTRRDSELDACCEFHSYKCRWIQVCCIGKSCISTDTMISVGGMHC